MALIMPPQQSISDAGYYRRRARESRELASKIPDAAIRKQIRHIAEGYDQIAEQAEAGDRDHPEKSH